MKKNNEKPLIEIENAIARRSEFCFEEPLNWTLFPGQNWAVTGPNGGGKTLFADYLVGKISLKSGFIHYNFEENTCVYDKIKSISFRDIYSLTDNRNMYYQQRWNTSENENSLYVKDLFSELKNNEKTNNLSKVFNIADLLEKRLVFLSSGELRKILIIKTLLSEPRILVLDNPYIGLDSLSRDTLNDLLRRLISKGIHIVLLLANPDDIPDFITHILPVNNKKCGLPFLKDDFINNQIFQEALFPSEFLKNDLPEPIKPEADYDDVLCMNNIHIQYGERIILDNLNWIVKKAEKWALLGPNGSGKSTLLSLIYADNPQAYANTFYLFGKKRGTGESIWDIKSRIGYVSPEIHLYSQYTQTCLKIVGSGFFDSIGLYGTCSESQIATALNWMKVFGVDHLCERSFLQLSFGEQRLVLLARAFVKDPELLILDEPLHGLDKIKRRLAIQIIEKFCERPGKTLIYVTHYQNEIPDCIDKYKVLEKRS